MISLVRWTCLATILFACTQATAFENLDFEQAMPVITGDSFEDCCNQTLEDLLPHWSAIQFDDFNPQIGDSGFALVYNQGAHIGGHPPIVSLFDQLTNLADLYGPPLSIGFTVAIDTRGSNTTELFQTGSVPSDSNSIRFSGALHTSGSSVDFFPLDFMLRAPAEQIEMSLGGVDLTVVELSDEGGFATYGANIPPTLEGSEAELRFVVPTDYFLLLDDFHFSPIPVPEPATFAGLTIALGAWLGVRRSRG